MKAYDVALYLIFTLLSVNILSASGFLGSDISVYYGQQASLINNTVQSPGVAPANDEALSYSELAISAFGLLVRSLVAVLAIILYSTVLLPVFLWQLSMPAEVNLIITVGVWISYVIGYAQYRARSSLLGTE